MSTYKALVIGCGNIGAGYDFSSEAITTHAKAYYLNPAFELYVYDYDPHLAQKVARAYKGVALKELEAIRFSDFDIVSIASPTPTHKTYLERCLKEAVPVVICEKPVATESGDIENLQQLYGASSSKVIVNYPRQFSPDFEVLKEEMAELVRQQALRSCIVKYQNGWLNNASHALNFLEHVENRTLSLDKVHISHRDYSYAENDPLLTLDFIDKGCHYHFIPLPQMSFSFLDIEFFFEQEYWLLSNGAREIKKYRAEAYTDLKMYEKKTAYQDNMRYVIEYAQQLLEGKKTEDNFKRSTTLNQQMIALIHE